MRYIEDTIKTHINGARLSLFPHFPSSTLLGRLTVFHETRRQCPFTIARLNRALAEQHLVADRRNTAANNFGINVENLVTGWANIALTIFALGDFSLDLGGALGTILHETRSFVSHRCLRSISRAATVTHCPSPSESSRFQKGASVLSVSMTNSQALKASAR